MIARELLSSSALATLQESGELFAVLDACDAPAVPLLCEGLGPERSVSLYRGGAEEEYADIAPYLVHVDSAELLEWVVRFSETEGWGILVVAPVTLEALRTHLRKFLKVQDPSGARVYFRFYDPRVLEIFLPTCDDAQLALFFGPVRSYGVRSPEGDFTRFRFAGAERSVSG